MRSFWTISLYSPRKAASDPSLVISTQRHAPPTRRSIWTLVTSPRSPPHQRPTSSGSVHALYTRRLGAPNSRVMRICSSLGNVTVAAPLLAIATPLFLLQLFQHRVQPVEATRPEALIALHPVVDGP